MIGGAHEFTAQGDPALPGNNVARLYLCSDADSLARLADHLGKGFGISRCEIDGVFIDARDMACRAAAAQLELAIIPLEQVSKIVGESDVVLVAGADFGARLDRLYSLGVRGLYNGNALLRDGLPAERIARLGARYFVGPVPATERDPAHRDSLRFHLAPLTAGQIPASTLFVVNSLPKSGSIWLCAMLEEILGVRTREQITLSHVADIEEDWDKPNNHGAVVLLRDLRDVVVSWFHHCMRSDRQMGFVEPRYPSLGRFYWEYFVGALRGSARYYHGDLDGWIDRMSASHVPILTYEGLCANPAMAVSRLLNAWQISVDPAKVAAAVEICRFASLQDGRQDDHGYVGVMLGRAHLRKGQPGSWQSELPPEVARDISQRFAGYQERWANISALATQMTRP